MSEKGQRLLILKKKKLIIITLVHLEHNLFLAKLHRTLLSLVPSLPLQPPLTSPPLLSPPVTLRYSAAD